MSRIVKDTLRVSPGDVITFVVSLVAAAYLVSLALAWWASSPFHY